MALGVASALLLGAALLTALYAFSYDATATVRDVNEDASSCLVEWQQGNRTRVTHVDCGSYDAAGVALSLPIVAQPDPFADQAFAGERSEIIGIDGTILAAVLVILGFGVWRARGPRHGTLLTPVLVDEAVSERPASLQPTDGPQTDSAVLGLAERVTALQGWPSTWDANGVALATPRRDLVGAVTGIGWWTPVMFLAAGSALDPRGLGNVLWAVTAVAVLVQMIRAVRSWLLLRTLWTRPVSSEWDSTGLPSPDGYAVLLCIGATPHWLVEVTTMPPVSGRMRVRGDLAGQVVHLVTATGEQVLLGRAERFSDELDDEVCGFLRSAIEEYEEDLAR